MDHAIVLDAGGLGLLAHKALDRLAGAALGDGFEPAADKDQRNDDGCGLEIDVARFRGHELRGEGDDG
ncbi:hypothetical protein D3C71_2203280 [compost metagenome]